MFPGLMFLFTYTIHRQGEESARTGGGCAGFQEGRKNILCGQHKCVQRGGGFRTSQRRPGRDPCSLSRMPCVQSGLGGYIYDASLVS